MTTIGVVGVEAMGRAIAGRLRSLSYDVVDGNSPRKAAEAADVVFSMVTDTEGLETVTAGPNGILAGLGPGKVYVDLSTVCPQTGRELAERVAELGASMLAAPVSGSATAAQEGSLEIIVGGDTHAFARVEPILRRLGSTVTFVGDNAQALLLKLATNVSLAVQVLAFNEGMLLADRGGIERDVTLEVLNRSAISSPLQKIRAPFEQADNDWFDVHELLSAARVLGYEHCDIAALFQVFAEMVEAEEHLEPLEAAAG
jgi:3-hydroxyisobutyrate dehydrogenase-like beta-hydroxyacid dehydrogenase